MLLPAAVSQYQALLSREYSPCPNATLPSPQPLCSFSDTSASAPNLVVKRYHQHRNSTVHQLHAALRRDVREASCNLPRTRKRILEVDDAFDTVVIVDQDFVVSKVAMNQRKRSTIVGRRRCLVRQVGDGPLEQRGRGDDFIREFSRRLS